jgi:hypothetical protein
LSDTECKTPAEYGLQQNAIHIPPPYPLTHIILYLFIQGRGGDRVEPERREEGQQGRVQITSWIEKTNMTECTEEIVYHQSINSDKHLPQSPFIGQFI